MANSGIIMNPNELVLCTVCSGGHTPFERCDYDNLIRVIHHTRSEKNNLLAMNKKLSKENMDLVDTAKNFQQVIKNIEPELRRLLKFEASYKKRANARPKELSAET